MASALIDAYKFHRLRRLSARNAIVAARKDVADGTCRYPSHDTGMGGGEPFAAYGEAAMMWFERPGDYMRLVGHSSDIINMRHDGWYVNDSYHETARGVVYQLPARNGETLFLYGYEDPHNEGAACLSLTLTADKEDAARWADGIAERMAEEERAYQEAWRAGRDYEELADDISVARRACLALIAEAKRACVPLSNCPLIKQSIRDKVEGFIETIREARDKREELVTSFGRCNGFYE